MLTDNEWAEIIAGARAVADMPSEERRAADLLKQLRGGDYTPRDVGGAQGMHDFDLRLDDGKVLAVEVTTDTSAVDRAFQDQIDRIGPLMEPGLARVWHVDLATPGAGPDDQQASHRRVKALQAKLPEILLQLELAGLTELSVLPDAPRGGSALHGTLRGLGVQMCVSFDPAPGEKPQVFFGDASHGGVTGQP